MKLLTEDQEPVVLETTDGDQATIRCARAAPPGKPLSLRTEGGAHLVLKVRRCSRTETGYELLGRWVSLTRELKAQLMASAAPPQER